MSCWLSYQIWENTLVRVGSIGQNIKYALKIEFKSWGDEKIYQWYSSWRSILFCQQTPEELWVLLIIVNRRGRLRHRAPLVRVDEHTLRSLSDMTIMGLDSRCCILVTCTAEGKGVFTHGGQPQHQAKEALIQKRTPSLRTAVLFD